jgi:hypothetical protein
MALELADCLYMQAKHEEALTAWQEARAIAADFKLPTDAAWRKTLQTWLPRARELGNAELAASIETELTALPPDLDQRVTILDKIRRPTGTPRE